MEAETVVLDCCGEEGRGGGDCMDDGHGEVEHEQGHEHAMASIRQTPITRIEVSLRVPEIDGPTHIHHNSIIGNQAYNSSNETGFKEMHLMFIWVDEGGDPGEARYQL